MPNGRVAAFTRNPARDLHAQPVAGAVILFVVLVAIAWARRQRQPDQEHLIAFAVAAAAGYLEWHIGAGG